ncbi:hypothetical protein Fcan01_11042 [Folsomia candida]|uniref:F-box domain-containing protein n=1 Tax=Folsomia candida TaxID=158441 RepID=A0A226E8H8_FOLCA|nr:hypothetical protein Fcan01_11042 [Folsomia candida]
MDFNYDLSTLVLDNDAYLARSVLENPLIMSKVFSYLCLNEVKNIRLVSHAWQRNSIQTMRRLSFIKVNHRILLSYCDVLQKADDTFLHSSYAICHDVSDANSLKNNALILKFFYSIQTHHFVKIRFLRVILGNTNLQYIKSLLNLLPHLETLEIVLGPLAKAGKILSDDGILLGKGNLYHLKTVAFVFANISKKQAKRFLGPLFSVFLSMQDHPPNLRQVEIFDKSKKSEIGAEVLREIETWKLRRLRDVQLMYGGSKILKQLVLQGAFLNVLKVGVVGWDDLPLLKEVLAKYAKTLKVLKVEVSTGTTKASRAPMPVHLMIGSRKYSPGMLKHYGSLATLEDLSFLDYMNVTKILKGGEALFSKTFPSMFRLELKLCGGYTRYNDIFFANFGKDVVIPQIKEFSMELLNWGTEGQRACLLGRLAKLFPNIDVALLQGSMG